MKNKVGLVLIGVVSAFLVACSDDSSVEYYQKNPEIGYKVFKACDKTFMVEGKKLTVQQCDNALIANGHSPEGAHRVYFYKNNVGIAKSVVEACTNNEKTAGDILLNEQECKNAKDAYVKAVDTKRKQDGYKMRDNLVLLKHIKKACLEGKDAVIKDVMVDEESCKFYKKFLNYGWRQAEV